MLRKSIVIVIALAAGGGLALLRAQDVKVVVSSQAGDRLAARPSLHFAAKLETNRPEFLINEGVTYQKMDGFGASLLEAGLICINSLPPEKQEVVLRSLFDPQTGAGYSAMKTVIGGTDFQSAGPWFTYNDTPGDVEMKNFSIARDLGPNGEITFIKRARKHGSFVLQAPMDYPPDWMLTNVRDRKKQNVNPKYYDALALYYLKFLQEYEKNGVFIDYLSLFNEPGVYTKVPYSDIRELLKNHVGPLLAKAGVRTKIQLSEAPAREDAYKNYHIALDDPEALKYVGGLAYHGYDWTRRKGYGEIADVHKKYPQFPMWMTEVCYAYEAGVPKSMKLPRYDFEDGDFWANMILSDLETGASAWIYWNMILDEKGGPWAVSEIHGNPDPNIQHPIVIINRENKQVTYTGLYYYLAHFSKFVRPGDLRIEAKGVADKVRCMAFKSQNGRIIVQLVNSGNKPVDSRLEWHDKTLPVDLPAVSITTLTWQQ
ncbi:MAG TPA: glycoside hydrolase family 30 beta sandwich domain-containing protein [Acidobacteriota bacterium]|nr:glycoside hydrolase family 30 beta sandwich domain-containing protein [Acidobacteriota bacterium]